VWCLETASLVEGEGDSPVVIQGTLFDITERKRMEATVQKSEARFRTLFQNAPLCLFEIDLARTPPTVLRTNRQTEAVYGWSLSEITSLAVPELFSADALPDHQRLVDLLLTEDAVTLESTHQRKDGSTFPVRLGATRATASEPKRIILAVEDISAERSRRSEEEAIAEERRRMAREIHDGLAQNLASLRLRARLWHNIIDQDPDQMHTEVEAMRALLREQIQDVRRSIFALRPVALDELGFFPALRQFVSDFGEQNSVHTDLRILGSEERLPSRLEPVLFRIVQEALNNVSKHAQANTVWLELDLGQADSVSLTIRDDGIGFDPEQLDEAAQAGHLGLTQMRERVEELEGQFLLQVQPERETEIRVVLPAAPVQGGL
jgi:PAS domain S-box-containing protein